MALEINLYAEFLKNIRSCTIYGTLRNKNKTYTKAFVTSDEKTISLTYDDQTTSIALPLGLKVKGSIGIPVQEDPADLSLRLEILEDEKNPYDLETENDSPWSSHSLGSETVIACKQCQTQIVPTKQRHWKDLPRGLWAETLDQWYCHRPEVDGVPKTVYTGSTGPQLESGTALVDTCHFVVAESDCEAVEKVNNNLQCETCSTQIGIFDTQLHGFRLYKWSLLVCRSSSDVWEGNEIQNFICAQMLELMEDQNVRKFLAFSGKLSEAKNGSLIWVFNPDITYSSSEINQGRPRRAMKVLYEKVANPSEIADRLQLAVEDLPLPPTVLEQLEKDLEYSHNSLPDPAKKVLPPTAQKKWKVALLARFDDRKIPVPG